MQDASTGNGGSSASERQASDENAHGNERREEEAKSKTEDERPCSEAEDAEKEMDADLIRMKTLRTPSSTHDDWLHSGSYLREIAFHTYAEYIDRARLPRHAPAEEQIFHFEPHYALSRSYCQRTRTAARIPVLEALNCVPPDKRLPKGRMRCTSSLWAL